MSKNVAIVALALWLLVAVALNVTLISQETSGPAIQLDDLAEALG